MFRAQLRIGSNPIGGTNYAPVAQLVRGALFRAKRIYSSNPVRGIGDNAKDGAMVKARQFGLQMSPFEWLLRIDRVQAEEFSLTKPF